MVRYRAFIGRLRLDDFRSRNLQLLLPPDATVGDEPTARRHMVGDIVDTHGHFLYRQIFAEKKSQIMRK
jgi:hypothetical protein